MIEGVFFEVCASVCCDILSLLSNFGANCDISGVLDNFGIRLLDLFLSIRINFSYSVGLGGVLDDFVFSGFCTGVVGFSRGNSDRMVEGETTRVLRLLTDVSLVVWDLKLWSNIDSPVVVDDSALAVSVPAVLVPASSVPVDVIILVSRNVTVGIESVV